jgi:hypothetical protein
MNSSLAFEIVLPIEHVCIRKYYEVELENVMIASMEQVIHGGSILYDSIGLRFSKVKWKYTQRKIGGGACGSTAGGRDLADRGMVMTDVRVLEKHGGKSGDWTAGQ